MLGGKTVADKYCDLVMKGGITSGIVYPNAVLALAREYRFKSIGGTSAGAIAAAV
ncbi:TPA: patatin-like phospholipase family protein, partial [Stenotrophomonas maltophilia]|nr:patatin-like phospholipase family protein [Stenotrophomonas maltophilia]